MTTPAPTKRTAATPVTRMPSTSAGGSSVKSESRTSHLTSGFRRVGALSTRDTRSHIRPDFLLHTLAQGLCCHVQVVAGLQRKPEPRTRAEEARQPHGRIRRDAPLAQYDLVDPLAVEHLVGCDMT